MYPGPRHTSLLGRVLNLRRLLNEYRWELWLFIGIPSVAATVGPIGLAYTWDVIASDDGWFFSAWRAFSTSVVAAVLLGASYAKVRRLEGFMLKLFWRYSLAASVVSALGFLTISLLSSQPWDPFDLGFVPFYLRWVLSLLALAALGGLVRLWFAREASRFSLAHAFLVIALSGSTAGYSILLLPVLLAFRTLAPTSRDTSDVALQLGTAVLGTAITVLSIWALANFDGMGRRLRRRSLVALLALGVLHAVTSPSGVAGDVVDYVEMGNYMSAALVAAISLLGVTVFTLIVLGLTYLLRVRQPAEPPTGVSATT